MYKRLFLSIAILASSGICLSMEQDQERQKIKKRQRFIINKLMAVFHALQTTIEISDEHLSKPQYNEHIRTQFKLDYHNATMDKNELVTFVKTMCNFDLESGRYLDETNNNNNITSQQ